MYNQAPVFYMPVNHRDR